MAKCIMVQGTMSGVGKSLLCAALCRIFRQDGLRVAPFKSQNMALNSCVTRDGLEMGRAQAVQAEAAGREPDVRMNPVLLKPSSDTGSQVIVNGRVRGQMTAAEYFPYKKKLIPEILEAFRSLAAENDVIVIEGAGSPAEINLRADDIVNMGLAELLDAPVILAGDIDRGGVFAQLYGTAALVGESEKKRIRGLVINKFRGDPEILRPGLRQIEDLTGIPVLGVVPYLSVDIDDEDSLSPRLAGRGPGIPISGPDAAISGPGGPEAGNTTAGNRKVLDIAVVRLPRISNFTDFIPLEQHPLMALRYAGRPEELGSPDLVILPGTKSTMADLLWMRQNGLEAAVQKLAAAGTPVLGICGGYQMLGREIRDPEGLEGSFPVLRGMDLLPCVTRFTPEKTLTRVRADVTGGMMRGAGVEGYEIHMGETERLGGVPFSAIRETEGGPDSAADTSGAPDAPGAGTDAGAAMDGCCAGNIAGTYLHGLFDSGEAAQKLAEQLCRRKGIEAAPVSAGSRREYRERQYDLLADAVRKALDMDAVRRILEESGK